MPAGNDPHDERGGVTRYDLICKWNTRARIAAARRPAPDAAARAIAARTAPSMPATARGLASAPAETAEARDPGGPCGTRRRPSASIEDRDRCGRRGHRTLAPATASRPSTGTPVSFSICRMRRTVVSDSSMQHRQAGPEEQPAHQARPPRTGSVIGFIGFVGTAGLSITLIRSGAWNRDSSPVTLAMSKRFCSDCTRSSVSVTLRWRLSSSRSTSPDASTAADSSATERRRFSVSLCTSCSRVRAASSIATCDTSSGCAPSPSLWATAAIFHMRSTSTGARLLPGGDAGGRARPPAVAARAASPAPWNARRCSGCAAPRGRRAR